VTKGASPGAPEGGHSSHAGTLLDVVPVALPDDPPEFAEDEDGARELLGALDRVPAVPPPDAGLGAAAPEVDPVAAAPPVVAVVVDCAAVTGFAVLPGVVVGVVVAVPRVTTPPDVTLDGFTAV
jgi:hypothetical protein